MLILHTADLHLGKTTHSSPGTTSRADDYAAALMRFAEAAVDKKVDIAVIAGDVFHTRRPLPRDLYSLTQALSVLRSNDILTLITPGNHDGMDTVGDERTHALAWMKSLQPKGVRIFTSPASGVLQSARGQRFNIVTTPYPHKRSFDSLLPQKTPEERTEAISQALESSIVAMLEDIRSKNPDLPTIYIGHLSVIGAAIGSETTMRFGWDVTVRSGIFDEADYAALGHIHRQQQLSDKAWYAGSPEYMDFGEQGQSKGFLLVEVEKGKKPVVEVVDSNPRPMLTIELRQEGEDYRRPAVSVDGAIVNLVIHPEKAISPAEVMALVKEVRDDGASFVQYRVVTPERQIARAKVDAQVEVNEALRRWLEANGHPIEPLLSAGMQLISEVDGQS